MAPLSEHREPAASPVAVDRLVELSDGTGNGLRELVELYLESVGEDFAEMRDALARAETGDLQGTAHRAGGSCWTCGAHALAALLREVEQLARDGRLGDVEATLDRAAAEHRRVRQFLLHYVETR